MGMLVGGRPADVLTALGATVQRGTQKYAPLLANPYGQAFLYAAAGDATPMSGLRTPAGTLLPTTTITPPGQAPVTGQAVSCNQYGAIPIVQLPDGLVTEGVYVDPVDGSPDRFFLPASFQTDAAWNVLGASGQPALQNSWVNYDAVSNPAQFRKLRSGEVLLGGFIKSGTTTADTVLFNLPVGYRPGKLTRFMTFSNSALAQLYIDPANGNLRIGLGVSAANLNLDGIHFFAEN